MPSAEDTTYLIKVMPETTQDFLTRDVDILVSQIKENLRLTSLKAKSSVSQRARPSPYLRGDMRRGDYCHNRVNKNNNNNKETENDPYETLRELLKQGRLISEAVKKLQTMNFNDISNSNSECEDDDKDEHEDNDVHHQQQHHQHHRGYRRKTYYYDSEDEPLPEVYQSLDL